MASMSELLARLEALESYRLEYRELRFELEHCLTWQQRTHHIEPLRAQFAVWESQLMTSDRVWIDLQGGHENLLSTQATVRNLPGGHDRFMELAGAQQATQMLFDATGVLLSAAPQVINGLRAFVNLLREQEGNGPLPAPNRLN